jgi:hypothetical protein
MRAYFVELGLEDRDRDLGFSGPAPALPAWNGTPVAKELRSAARARRGCIGPTLFEERCGGVVVTLLTRAPFISVKHRKA